jgi:hypothetical protein
MVRDGELQILLDRRLHQDDGKGMGEPLVDNANVQVCCYFTVATAVGSRRLA